MYIIIRNIVRFVFLVLFQILIMDNVMINGYLIPYFYILFLILMPFETPKWMQLVTGFFLGLSIDLHQHTLGMHTAATVFIAFLRPYLLNLFAPRDGYEPDTFPRIHYYGLVWFFKYAAIITFAHHLLLFYLEIFSLSEFFSTFLRVILSTLLSVSTIVLSQYFIFRK